MDPVLLTTLVLSAVKLITEMADNWDNPDYKPPSSDELRALAKQLEELPDLPT